MSKETFYQKYMKRILDIIVSGLALCLLGPLMLVLALVVRKKLGSPVLFRQARPGKNEAIFYLYKYRSMTNAVDECGKLLPDSQRLTKFGRLLRKSSLDELPELLNIIKGDMSLVGPRPLSIYYLPHYDAKSRHRHDVRPGLTGLAQVNGRNHLNWEERFAFDMQYVENVTFWNDMKIILNTVRKVLKSADVSVRGTTKLHDFGTHHRITEEGGTIMHSYAMTYPEIGSYFWLGTIPENTAAELPAHAEFLPPVKDDSFTFSGRTAIEIALRDAMRDKSIRTAYVPSYCCVSMLQSLIDHDIGLRFYDVCLENGRISYCIDSSTDCDLILFMRYFGMECESVENTLAEMQHKGVVVIEDITHSLFSREAALACSTYYVASLRKWFAAPAGGWVGKTSGVLQVKPNLDSNHAVKEKIQGMKMKYEFICGERNEKTEYLLLNSKFDNDLIHVDRMLKIDDISRKLILSEEIETIIARRTANVRRLQEGLQEMEDITLPEINPEHSVPLFYPIFLEQKNRDSLRRFLIANNIYCPVHWPEVMGADAGIREQELSLICDQRYTEKDMDAILRCIHDWQKENRE